MGNDRYFNLWQSKCISHLRTLVKYKTIMIHFIILIMRYDYTACNDPFNTSKGFHTNQILNLNGDKYMCSVYTKRMWENKRICFPFKILHTQDKGMYVNLHNYTNITYVFHKSLQNIFSVLYSLNIFMWSLVPDLPVPVSREQRSFALYIWFIEKSLCCCF